LEALEDRALLTAFMVANLGDAGDGSLRQAIIDANDMPGADVIEFADGLEGTIGLTSGELAITDELTIDGPGSDELTISGSGLNRVFNVDGSTVAIDDLTIADGAASDTVDPIALGGGILNWSGDLTVSGVTFVGNQAAGLLGSGGAIANISGASTMVVDSTFRDNLADGIIVGSGGAIVNDDHSNLSVSDSTFIGNRATGGEFVSGGAIENLFGSQATVSGSMFDSNVAHGRNGEPGGDGGIADGGAISNLAVSFVDPGYLPATLIVRDSTFVGNESIGGEGGDGGDGGVGSGGAIANINSALTVEDSKFRMNLAIGGDGGNDGDEADGGNGANGRGGAIINTAFNDAPLIPPTVSIADTIFLRNVAAGGNGGMGGDGGLGGDGGNGLGGGLRNAIGTMNVAHSKLKLNEATGGNGGDSGDGVSGGNGGNGLGGGIVSGFVLAPSGITATTNISDTSITNNRATGGAAGTGGNGGNGSGGGIFSHVSSIITLTDSKVNANRAVGGDGGGSGIGGGVYTIGQFNTEESPNIHGNKASTSHDNVFGDLTLLDDLLALV
jgi:hypothetical protein